jgi:F-type H+-transporting ATPase subunit b
MTALVAGVFMTPWLASAARAADEAAAGAHAAGGSHAAQQSEQVEIFRPAIELGIWTVAVFGLLLILLRVLAWGPMIEGLQKREQAIHGAIQEAARTREEAQRLRDQLQTQMDHAAERVRDLMDEARRNAQQHQDEMIAAARTEIQSERDRLRREIETARDQALQELWSQTARLATVVSAKAIRRHLSEDDHRRLVDEALAEVNRAMTDNRKQRA